MSTDRKAHRFAEIFPMFPDDELQELAESIKKRGLDEPIMLFENEILDGRNRYAACKMAGIAPRMKVFSGTEDEALQYVTSHNLHRRHLTASQRAMIAAKIADMPVGKPAADKPELEAGAATTPGQQPAQKSPAQKSPAKKKTTIDQAANKLNVSRASVKKAKAVIKKSPAKAREVEAGTKSLDQAHQEVQKETGSTTDSDVAVKLGNTAIATLGRIKTEFRKDIFERVKIWIDANIEL